MGTGLARARHRLLGYRASAIVPLLAPTMLSVAIDLVLRGREFWVFEPHGKAIYFSSLLVSAGFWVLPLLVGARLVSGLRGDRARACRVALVALFAAWVLPLSAGCYGGQLVYFHVFHAYLGRDTLRLGALLRGGYVAWFFAWGSLSGIIVAALSGVLITFVLFGLARRQAREMSGPLPLLPVLTFAGALFCFFTDNVDSRFLQAATPDTCFLNGVVHALRAATTGGGRVRQGVTLRQPTPLPRLVSERPRPPNVVLILTESVRADTLCSDPPDRCPSRFLDADGVAPDRIPLGKLTSQTPNTFSACMVLWSGLEPNADFADAHEAPLLWEIAHAVGYETAYVTSQNAKYEDFGVYVEHAGIDYRRTSTDLGGMAHEQLGAPDERATADLLRFLRGLPLTTPVFAVLHLSNTHHPYRVDPGLQPFAPHSDDPSRPTGEYFNHYRNSVLWQERLVSDFVREVRTLPTWDETVIVFVSDHAEQFGEHGLVHHNHSVWDVELRVPGWLVAGARAVDARQREALRTYAGVRTFSEDVNATIVDLFGVASERATLPFRHEVVGRSLLRTHESSRDPEALLATSTGVWEPNDAWFGVMQREHVLVGSAKSAWRCFDTASDPEERHALPAKACGGLVERATRAFAPGIGTKDEPR